LNEKFTEMSPENVLLRNSRRWRETNKWSKFFGWKNCRQN